MASPLPARVAIVANTGEPRLIFCEAAPGENYRFTVADLAQDIQDDFRVVATEAARSLRDGQAPIDYAATERPAESQYAVLPKSAAGGWGLLRPTLLTALEAALNYAVLPDADLAAVRPRFYCIVLHLDNDVALFGRAIQPRNIPKKSMRINTVFRDGVLHRVEEELVLFDENIDWIYWKNTFYILNMPGFERIFLDRQRLTGQVRANVEAIARALAIIGQAELEGRCAGNLNMAVKLRRIVDRGAHANWPPAQLRAYTSKYRPAIQWQGNAIVFDGSPAHQWDILKLLDEAWFTGELSQDHFEATSKIET
jgi:hypothetical protein